MARNDNVQVTVNYQNDRLPAGQPITISYSNPSQWTVVDWETGVSKQLSNDLTATNNGNGTFTVKSNVGKDLDINFDLHFALQYADDVKNNTPTPLVITTKRGSTTVNTTTVKPIIIPYKDNVVADEIAHGWAAKDVHKVKTNFDNTHDILSGTKATTGKEADNREVMQYMIEWNYGKAGNTKGTTLSPLQTADFTAYLSKGQTMLPDTIKVFRVYQPNAVDGNGQRVSIYKSYSKITDCVNGVFVNEDPAFEQFLKDHLTVTVNNSTTQLSWRDYQAALQKAKHDGTEPPLVNGIHLNESNMAHVKLSTDANGQSHNFSVNVGNNEDSTVKSPHSTFFIQFDILLDYNMPVSWTKPGDGPSISYNRASGKFDGIGTQINKSTSKVFQGGGNGFTHQIAYEATLHFADITNTGDVASLDTRHGVGVLNGHDEENASGSTDITFDGQSDAIKKLEEDGYQLVGASKGTLTSGKYNGSNLYDSTGTISYGTYGQGTKKASDPYTYVTSFTLQFVRTAALQHVSKTATRTVYYKKADANQPDPAKLVDLAKKVDQSVSFSGSQYQDAQGKPVAVVTLEKFKNDNKLHVNKGDDKVYVINPAAEPEKVTWQPKAGENSTLSKSTVSFNDENRQTIKDKDGNIWYITPATQKLGIEEVVPSTKADKDHTDVYLIYDRGQRALLRYHDDDAQAFLDKLAQPINAAGQTGDAIAFSNDQQELNDLLNKHYIYVGISRTNEKHAVDGAKLGQYKFGNFDNIEDQQAAPSQIFVVHVKHAKKVVTNLSSEQRVIKYFDAQTNEELNKKTKLADEVVQPVSWKQTAIVDQVMNNKVVGYNLTGKKDANNNLLVETKDPAKSWVVTSKASDYSAVKSPYLTFLGYEKLPSFSRKSNQQDAAVVEKKAAQPNVPGGEVDVYYFHAHAPQSRTVKVNEVIHYRYKDTGKTAAPDFVAKPLSFTQTGYKDMVTNVVVWNGQWTPAQEFKAVTSPEIRDYTPDKSVIQAQRVEHNSPDLEFLVLYSKKAQPTQPTQPTVPTQPTKPTVPTQPTQPTAPTQPTKPTVPTQPTRPTVPTQPTKPTVPTQPTKPTVPTQPTKPTVPTQPTKPTVPTQPTKPTVPTQPTKPTVPTQPTRPTVPTAPTSPTQPTRPTQPTNPVQPTQLTAPTEPQTPKQPNRQLPQTGRKGNMGIVAGALAAMFAGSLGLGFKKRRN